MNWIPVALLLVFGVVPVLYGLTGTLIEGAHANGWAELLATPGLSNSLLLSAWTGLASTCGALALAHATIALVWTPERIQRLRLTSLPVLASPHLAIAIGIVLLMSPSGLILRALSPWATGFQQPPDWATVQDAFGWSLILGLTVKETPFLILVLLANLSQVNAQRLMTQARVLGYGPLKAWFVAVAPLLQQRSRLAVAAVLVFGVTNVEMSMALGPTTPPALPILVWQWFTDPDLALRPRAFAGALLLLVLAGIAALLLKVLSTAVAAAWRRWAASGRRPAHDRFPLWLTRTAGRTVLAFGIFATLALILRSFGGAWRFPQMLPERWSLESWFTVLQDTRDTFWTTLQLALAVSMLAVVIVLAAAEALHDRSAARRRIAALLFLPLILPQMAYLFGLQGLLLRLRLDGTWHAVLWSQLVFALPYAWVVLAEARAQLNPGYRIVAHTLGAGAVKTWTRVILPMLARPILLAVALCFSVSMALYLPTLFAGGGRIVTLTTEAAVAINSGDLRSAAAQGAMLTALPLVVFGVCALLSRRLFRHRAGMAG